VTPGLLEVCFFQIGPTCNYAHVVLLFARIVGGVQKLSADRDRHRWIFWLTLDLPVFLDVGEVVPPAPSTLRLSNLFRGAPSVIDK
jgi:hypothetical protein